MAKLSPKDRAKLRALRFRVEANAPNWTPEELEQIAEHGQSMLDSAEPHGSGNLLFKVPMAYAERLVPTSNVLDLSNGVRVSYTCGGMGDKDSHHLAVSCSRKRLRRSRVLPIVEALGLDPSKLTQNPASGVWHCTEYRPHGGESVSEEGAGS